MVDVTKKKKRDIQTFNYITQRRRGAVMPVIVGPSLIGNLWWRTRLASRKESKKQQTDRQPGQKGREKADGNTAEAGLERAN